MNRYGTLFKDIAAAMVGAMATLPHAIACGLIATAPLGEQWSVIGVAGALGTATLFGIVTGLLGANPRLLSGPSVVTALAFAIAIKAGLAVGLSEMTAIGLASASLFVAGFFQIISGLFKLGYFVSFVPVPVLAGFISGTAVLVFFSALPRVLGIGDIPLWSVLLGNWSAIDVWPLSIGIVTVAATFLVDGKSKYVPPVIVGVAAGVIVFYSGLSFGLPSGPLIGLVDVANMGQGAVLFQSDFDWTAFEEHCDIALLNGISLWLLTTFDTVLAGSALDMEKNTTGDANRDLVVHGIFNSLIAVVGFLPGSGTISRSKAVSEAGGQTRLANYGTGTICLILLAGFSPFVGAMPVWVTAGMLLATAVQAFDKPTISKIKEITNLSFPFNRVLVGDVGVTAVVIATAVLFDLSVAVGVGIVSSVGLFVFGISRNPVRRTYRASFVRSNVQRPNFQIECLQRYGDQIAVLELQGALFFGSSGRLKDECVSLLQAGVKYLILDFKHLTSIDSTGCAVVKNINRICSDNGGVMMLSDVLRERRSAKAFTRKGRLAHAHIRSMNAQPRWTWLILKANGVVDTIGESRIFDDDALAECEELLLAEHGKDRSEGVRGIIRSSLIFKDLSRQQIICLGKYAQRHHYPLGENVCVQGEESDKAYLLLRGRMDVMVDIPNTEWKRRVSSLIEGTIFGEMALIDGEPRSASIVAATKAVCLSINKENLDKIRIEHPEIALVLLQNLNRMLVKRLRVADTAISVLEH